VALALIGGVAFFVLFPRLSWNVAARRATPGLFGGTTGMTDRVRLGGGGDIKTSARVVLRATLEPDPGVERLEQYWVGRRFDTFDGREWRGSGTEEPPTIFAVVGPANRRQRVQRIELLPAYQSRTLVGLDPPASFGSAQAITSTGPTPARLVVVREEEVHFATDGNAYRYVASSRHEGGGEPPLDPVRRARTLALPATIDPRVPALATRLVGAETDPERVARRLEQWLKSNLAYTLELPGDVEDPLADFLFQRKEGHCEHFATALAVLLRTRGIPARLVGGFYGGERIVDTYAVRAGDAHAWVEAWIDGHGWMRLDATPESGRGSQPIALLAQMTALYERLEELWRRRVVDYSLLDQVSFVRNLVRPPRDRAGDDEPDTPGRAPSRVSVKQLAAAVLAAALTFWLWRRLSRRRARRPHPAASFLEQIERRLARAHVARERGEGLEEISQRLAARRHPAAGALTQATRRYLEARFGDRPLSAAERKALLADLDRGLAPPAVTRPVPGGTS